MELRPPGPFGWPTRRGGREAEGSRLLSGLGGSNLPRGFESHPLRYNRHEPAREPPRTRARCDGWPPKITRVVHQSSAIADKPSTPRVGVAIAEIAARQHGVISMVQLRGLGLSRGQAADRCRGGTLHRLHHGVYAVGHRSLSTRGRYMA